MRILLPALLLLAAAACTPADDAGSPSPSGPASPVVSPTSALTPADASSPSPTEAAPTATPSTGLPAGTWTEVASRGDGSGFDHAQRVAYGGAGFLAFGYRLEGGEGGPRLAETYALMSFDGETWDEVAAPPFGHIADDLWVATNGEYVTSGPSPDAADQTVLLRSVDGSTWEPVVSTAMHGEVDVWEVDRGALGYLLMGQQTASSDPTLWRSDEGISWQPGYRFAQDTSFVQLDDIGAGDEGFVALGWRITDGVYGRFAFASGDGRAWVETPMPFGPEPADYVATAVLAPLGPDWFAVIPLRDGTLQVWSSANGIEWQTAGTIATVQINASEDPVLVNVDDTLYFSLGGEALPSGTGLWSSTDGVTWTEFDIGAGVASDAASGAGVVVLTGHEVIADGGGSIARIWATPTE